MPAATASTATGYGMSRCSSHDSDQRASGSATTSSSLVPTNSPSPCSPRKPATCSVWRSSSRVPRDSAPLRAMSFADRGDDPQRRRQPLPGLAVARWPGRAAPCAAASTAAPRGAGPDTAAATGPAPRQSHRPTPGRARGCWAASCSVILRIMPRITSSPLRQHNDGGHQHLLASVVVEQPAHVVRVQHRQAPRRKRTAARRG